MRIKIATSCSFMLDNVATMILTTLVKTSRLKLLSVVILGIALIGCSASKQFNNRLNNPASGILASIDSTYAPDKRTAVFNVLVDGAVLKGETTSITAKAELLRQLKLAGIAFIDSIVVLPSADMQTKSALANVSVANIRVQPDHKAELATQATMGTPLYLLKKQRGWYLVQTPDKYIGWIDAGAIHVMNKDDRMKWTLAQHVLFTSAYGIAYADTNATQPISDMVYGNIMVQGRSTANGFLEVIFPDGRAAYVHSSDCMNYIDWQLSRNPTTENIVASARQLLGIPYLWGGTSFKGVDCSGFTKTAYFMNGLVLPRDASQQVALGTEIDTTNNWQNLQPGDLLFFGAKSTDKRPERVVHVGMWLGNKEFIHASGLVQIGSLDPSSPNYDANEHRRFLRVKRISPAAALYDLRTYFLY